MLYRVRLGLCLVLLLLACSLSAYGQTSLRVFAGGANQRPDLMQKLFEEYKTENPGVHITVETGGSTSDLQRQYLSTVLSSKDPSIDIYLIDIVNPAQYAGAGWLEPLDAYVGGQSALQAYLPVYSQSNVANGRVAALPAYADAMFMYYRKDLLVKHGLKEPATWNELAGAARKVMDSEPMPTLQGLSIQGAPIEGAVCTFLLPYWGQGRTLQDSAGKPTLDKEAAVRGMEMWLKLVDDGIMKKNIADVTTATTFNEFKAGRVVFAINWSYAWNRFQSDADSKVRGKVGVMPLPAMDGGNSATCLGGWQWAVSAFSKNKAAAAKLVQYLAAPKASQFLATQGGLLPTRLSLYADPDVLRLAPWMGDAARAVAAAHVRPRTAQYGQISDVIRTNTSAILARSKTPQEGVDSIDFRLRRVLR